VHQSRKGTAPPGGTQKPRDSKNRHRKGQLRCLPPTKRKDQVPITIGVERIVVEGGNAHAGAVFHEALLTRRLGRLENSLLLKFQLNHALDRKNSQLLGLVTEGRSRNQPMPALEAAVWVFGKQTMGREKGFPGKASSGALKFASRRIRAQKAAEYTASLRPVDASRPSRWLCLPSSCSGLRR
jgi:hypothetical protein